MKTYDVSDLELAEGLERSCELTSALYRRITDAMGLDVETPVDHALCAGVLFAVHQSLVAACNSLVRRMHERREEAACEDVKAQREEEARNREGGAS
jgi:hypothetical protein